jgi:hypothetical protein
MNILSARLSGTVEQLCILPSPVRGLRNPPVSAVDIASPLDISWTGNTSPV